MTKKTVTSVGTNPSALPFPADPDGACAALRKGITNSAARIRGRKSALEAYMRTLQIAASYAKELYARDVEAQKVSADNARAASMRVKEKNMRAWENTIAEKQKAVDALVAKHLDTAD